jgi:DNA-binding NtrC family response regulator
MRPQPIVLHVEDDTAHAEVVARLLADLCLGLEIRYARCGREAMRVASELVPRLVLLDYRLPDADGLALLPTLRSMHPAAPIVVLTVVASPRLAVAALRAGATDYVVKDRELPVVLPAVVRELLGAAPPPHATAVPERGDPGAAAAAAAEPRPEADPLASLVGSSREMQRVREAIRIAAASGVPVLVEGETGTGKELVARAVHALSDRAGRPFVPVNCAAIPESLAESEFFGHARGAFTGAHREKEGLFQAACGGTLFLDEIEDMPPALQAKLLRVLQDLEYRPVGSNAHRRADVRLIAASNQSPARLVEDGRLRADLYYRLRVLRIALPSLRARREDMPALVTHFVDRFNRRYGARLAPPPPAFVRRLCAAAWPGNVRELENALLSLCAAAHARNLSLAATLLDPPPDGVPLSPIDERGDLLHVLDAHHWSRQAAARALGISRVTLWRRMVRLGIAPEPASQRTAVPRPET